MHDWHLKDWLRTLQVTQAELGRRTDYPKAKVSELVSGKQRYNRDIINDIASALHLQPQELLMPPEDAMHLRRLRAAAREMAEVAFLGTANVGEDLPERTTGTRG